MSKFIEIETISEGVAKINTEAVDSYQAYDNVYGDDHSYCFIQLRSGTNYLAKMSYKEFDKLMDPVEMD